jgi:hypothetical protein
MLIKTARKLMQIYIMLKADHLTKPKKNKCLKVHLLLQEKLLG